MNVTHTSTTRRYDIDWLRVLLILTVFVFHSLRFFDLEGWHVKNPTTSMGVQILIVFLSRWMMPAIFLVSGVSTYYALGKRGATAGQFLKERSLRLLVPLLVGLFTHVVLQGYLEQVSQNGYSGSFWQYYANSFNGLMLFGGTFNWIGNHLWYLEVLFVFSLVCLPLFIWLRQGSGQRVLAWIGERLSAPGAVYLLSVPTFLLFVFIYPGGSGILETDSFGGWNLPNHMLFFLSGFLFASCERLQDNILRYRWISLAAGLVTFLTAGMILLKFGEAPFGDPLYLLVNLFNAATAWCWILAILGFARKYLSFRTPLMEYANEAVMPFYVFHQTILLVVGFFVVRWAIPDVAKWIIILVASFGTIMALYEFLVRRINLLRILFGMKPAYKEKLVQKPAVQIS